MDRAPGLSVRLKLTLSYAGLLTGAGATMLAAAWLLLMRYASPGTPRPPGGLMPDQVMIRGNVLVALRVLVSAYAPTASVVLAFLLIFGLLGGWLLAGRMMAPLARITEATRLVGNGSLSHRVRLPGRRDEFRELADAFDLMLARLEAHVAEQRRFAGNASHELRTPLAITQTLLEVARSDPHHSNGVLVERLQAVNTRAIELIEALLLLSRIDQRSFTSEQVDLSLIAEEAIETLLPLAERRGITIETSGDISCTVGSPALLLQLMTNLVHNALVHNLPDEGTAWVTTGTHADGAVLTVENTGDELSPELLATVVEPFQRGARRIHDDHGGVGLGLAIVKSIVQAHDGTLAISPRAAGGLRVTVQLPVAQDTPAMRPLE